MLLLLCLCYVSRMDDLVKVAHVTATKSSVYDGAGTCMWDMNSRVTLLKCKPAALVTVHTTHFAYPLLVLI